MSESQCDLIDSFKPNSGIHPSPPRVSDCCDQIAIGSAGSAGIAAQGISFPTTFSNSCNTSKTELGVPVETLTTVCIVSVPITFASKE